jgi:hypothetical protein
MPNEIASTPSTRRVADRAAPQNICTVLNVIFYEPANQVQAGRMQGLSILNPSGGSKDAVGGQCMIE